MEENAESQVMRVQEDDRAIIKSRRVLKAIKERQSSFKFYSWDIVENYTYITYLTNFRYIFDSQAERKRVKVFSHLAKLLKTRNPHQIKSHHQKMMLRHKSVDQIIDYLRIKITKELTSKPQHVSVIEKINQEAEKFFIKELAIQNPLFGKNLPKKYKKASKLPNATPTVQKSEVKMEENPIQYICDKVKQQQNPFATSQIVCLKQQEQQDFVVRVYH